MAYLATVCYANPACEVAVFMEGEVTATALRICNYINCIYGSVL